METIITKKLLAFLETNRLLSDHQYGFRQARSTGDLLAYAVHAWSSALESYGESRVVSLDISKAFHRIWHKGLLAKLPMSSLHPTLIIWIASFLSGRSITIRVDGFLSRPHSIISGVPQGSVISPVLFIRFINDLLSSTSSRLFSFDYTYLCSSFSSNPQHLAYSNISPHRNTSASILTNDLKNVEVGVRTTILNSIKERQQRSPYHTNIGKISPLFSRMAVNWTFHLLSLTLDFLFHLI